jgi:hypothetical protein
MAILFITTMGKATAMKKSWHNKPTAAMNLQYILLLKFNKT